MDVALLYIDGCPNQTAAEARLREALDLVGLPGTVISRRVIGSGEEAVATGFRGSPTILIDGRDPFESGQDGFGLTCRVYPTPAGLRGSPTVEQLVRALGSRG